MHHNSMNSTAPVNPASVLSNIFLWSLFALSFPGFILNMIVFIMSFHRDVKGDYKWFILHLSIIDMIYPVSNIVHASFMLFPSDYDGIFCQISAFVHWYCILLSLIALLPLTFHRLCSLRYQRLADLISTKLGIVLIILICDVFAFLIVILYPTVFSRVIRSTQDYSCNFDRASSLRGTIYSAFALLTTPILFGMLVYINLRIIWILHERKKNNVGERNKAVRLKETQALVRATFAQATIPMLVQVPLFVTAAIYVAGGSAPAEWDTFAAFVHSANPISSAVITFLVVRPYRRAIFRRFGIVSPAEISSEMKRQERMSNITRMNSMIDMRHIDMEYLANIPVSGRRLPSIS